MCGTALPKPLLWNLQCARASIRHASRTRSPHAMHAMHAVHAVHAVRAMHAMRAVHAMRAMHAMRAHARRAAA